MLMNPLTPGLIVAMLLALLLPTSEAGAATYDFVNVFEQNATLSSGFSVSTFPVINNAGVVAYAAIGTNAENEFRWTIFTTDGSGPPAPLVTFSGGVFALAINDLGTVAAVVLTAGPDGGARFEVYRIAPDGSHVVLLEADGSGPAPYTELANLSINNAGQVAILARHDDGTDRILRLDVGEAVEIARSSELCCLSSPTINDAGVVAFKGGADPSTVFTGSGGALTDEAPDNPCGGGGSGYRPVINNDGLVISDCGAAPFYTANDGVVAIVIDGSEDPMFQSLAGGYSMNNLGEVAVVTGPGGHSTDVGLFTGNDPVASKVVRTGDVVFSGTVEAIRTGQEYINDEGQLTFLLQVRNGSTPTAHVVLATPVAADLVETAVSDPPGTALPGGRFEVTDTVRNQGNAAAAATATRYYLSADGGKSAGDTLLAVTRPVPGLAPGAVSTGTRTLTIPTSITHGAYFLIACADDTANVVERREANNCLASTTTIRVGRPDLVTTAVSAPPATALPGGSFSVTDTVMNQGLAAAAASTTRYYLSPAAQKTAQSKLLTGARAVAMLAPGVPSQGMKTVTVPSTIAPATYFLLACADDLARVVETDESNNCAVASAQITVGRPDLAVTALGNPPASAPRGTSFAITDEVTNHGALGAGPSTTRYYLSLDNRMGSGDRILTGTRAVPAIAAGATFVPPGAVSVTVPATLPAGTYHLLACADDLRRVVETSETNNCRAAATTVVVP
jgi:hypothetical protein